MSLWSTRIEDYPSIIHAKKDLQKACGDLLSRILSKEEPDCPEHEIMARDHELLRIQYLAEEIEKTEKHPLFLTVKADGYSMFNMPFDEISKVFRREMHIANPYFGRRDTSGVEWESWQIREFCPKAKKEEEPSPFENMSEEEMERLWRMIPADLLEEMKRTQKECD